MPMILFGQSYQSLWKQVEEAQRKDLPRSAYEVLREIVTKAENDRHYGQLLKAELLSAQTMQSISPDSLQPALDRMEQRMQQTSDEVLKVVWQTVLYKVGETNRSLEKQYPKPVLDQPLCQKLARVLDTDYSPFVIEGADSRYFGHDLLSVVGYELEDYQALYTYYEQTGARVAACLTAAHLYSVGPIKELDRLIAQYQDLEEAGELAIRRYRCMAGVEPLADRIAYIHEALQRWGGWRRMNELRNEELELTQPQVRLEMENALVRPGQSQDILLKDARHLEDLSISVYRVKARGDIDLNPSIHGDYKKLKPLLTPTGIELKRHYGSGRAPYEVYDDTLTLEGLTPGVYMLELNTQPVTSVIRRLYRVSDVSTLAEVRPEGQTRYVVVNSTTGQPIPGAHLIIKEYRNYNDYDVKKVTTDQRGEVLFKGRNDRSRKVFAYTDTDQGAPELNLNDNYYFDEGGQPRTYGQVFTDRSIYRPGQTVHAAAIVYELSKGIQQTAMTDLDVTFLLRDANYKVVERKTVATDRYGACSVDFTLPATALTGRFTVQTDYGSASIRVEEYKRPTFEVGFDAVTTNYRASDTIEAKGQAMSYAGVPVREAKVSYRVVRRRAFWWITYWRYWSGGFFGTGQDDTEVGQGETVTDADGAFTVPVPLTMPEDDSPMFYNFVVTAEVTDQAGETHSGTLSLPLGNRKQVFTVDLADKVLADEQPKTTFRLLNPAGNDIAATLRYRLDGGNWQQAQTNVPLTLVGKQMKSGRHHLEAICEGDTLERDFVVFSLNDKRPAAVTDDWFYVSASQFPNDGTPVTVQVGSSAANVHMVYSILSGNQVLETGAVDQSNALWNRKFSYKEAWGNGIVLTFAWVREGRCYTHTTTIRRPVPDKRLRLAWTTFRDRLTPGQEEEWTLTVQQPDGKPADAHLLAVLYDKSLDQIDAHDWNFLPQTYLPMPYTRWAYQAALRLNAFAALPCHYLQVDDLVLSRFNESVYPSQWGGRLYSLGVSRSRVMGGKAVMAVEESAPMMMAKESNADVIVNDVAPGTPKPEEETLPQEAAPQLRENLSETAFFYPNLTTDAKGHVALKFTLPESLTTWRFLSVANTSDMCYGELRGEAIAQKEVMLQPNLPRFLRQGDAATISARIHNLSDHPVQGKTTLRLLDPETRAVVFETSQPVQVAVSSTEVVAFSLDCRALGDERTLFVCQLFVSGEGFSDGEQHYLPLLPDRERVTVTVPFTQHEAGTKTIDLSQLVPADGQHPTFTVEYTAHPAWLMVQTLPAIGTPIDDNALSQAAAYYANAIGQHIIKQNPQAKTAFDLWKQERGTETSLTSELSKNQELKDLLLSETPWVTDADNENEQKQRLADFFDQNLMQNRLSTALGKLSKLQKGNGAWSWWDGMPGSYYMTVAISEMLVRLNDMTGSQTDTRSMLNKAFSFMGREVVEEVAEMKAMARKGIKPTFPSFKDLQWLYLCTLDGRELPANVKEANAYLLNLLKKDTKNQTLYEKALTAVILAKHDPALCQTYVKSLKEYTTYREDLGRYYDSPRAGYSWYDYRIPTQVVAIEALQRITPDDRQTIQEMQRWLLQEKRTQAWDTPINSVNAVYAFLKGNALTLTGETAAIQVDGQTLELPAATAALGYVKTTLPDASARTLTVEKTSEDTSWGAVYAQFTQASTQVQDEGSGLSIKRELLMPDSPKVGDRIKVRLTIVADRDLDFVQIIDRKAACMEPVSQLSGYRHGVYCTPKDQSTNYFFDRFAKGKHVIETEYYLDRPGTYDTGTCVVSCAYAPAFRAIAHAERIVVSDK